MGIDNLNTYYDPKIKEWRLNELKKHPDFSFNRIDISQMKPLRQLFKNHNFEAVINLAARAGVRASIENPWDYVDTNITGTLTHLSKMFENPLSSDYVRDGLTNN